MTAVLGIGAAWYYARTGLALAHYDAKAHLVVARRILDSLTPGWEQIGAVWLPVPHLINALPVQIDLLYRTGAFATAVSVLSHAAASAAIAATVLALTSSRAGALLAASVYATNPNVLYLQSTPMTEPLLFALTTVLVLLLTNWILAGSLVTRTSIGWISVLACLTRYEAWAITGAAFAAAGFAWWRRGHAIRAVLVTHSRLGLYPIAAIAGFMLFSRVTVGEWFVSGGFFVPDETLKGQPAEVLRKIDEGVELLGGPALGAIARVAIVVVLLVGLLSAGRSVLLVPLALFAAAALPVSAYIAGHPFRLRYELPLVVASAVVVGLAAGLFKRAAPFLAIPILALVLYQARPFDRQAPMIQEAQIDRHVAGRRHLTDCLQHRYDGATIMASMGALGHYMQELSWAGFALEDFLHEGNGPIWDSAFTRGPAPLVGWVLIEEAAEGGDAVIQRHRLLPRMLGDFDKVCAGGNVSLWQRREQRR